MAQSGPVVAKFENVEVMLAGTYAASTGPVTFSDSDVDDIVATPMPAGGWPVIIGHPASEDQSAPALGFVTKLAKSEDGKLLTSGTYNDAELATQSQEGGKYSRRSPGLARKAGKWQFEHQAQLGAVDPANQGLAPVKPEQVVFLSGTQGAFEECRLTTAKPADPPKEQTVTEKEANELKAKLARAEQERDAAKAELAKATKPAETESDDEAELAKSGLSGAERAELAELRKERLTGSAEKQVGALKNLALLPALQAKGTALLAALRLGDGSKVHLAGAKGKDGLVVLSGKADEKIELSVEDALVDFLRSVPAQVGAGPYQPQGKAAQLSAPGGDGQPDGTQRIEVIQAHMAANKCDYETAFMATSGGYINVE